MINNGFSPKALAQCVCAKLITSYIFINCKIFTFFVETFKCNYHIALLFQKRAIRIRLGSKAMKPAYYFKAENPNL